MNFLIFFVLSALVWGDHTSTTPIESNHPTREIGDVDGDGHNETIKIVSDTTRPDAGQHFAFVQSNLPPLPGTGSSCLHVSDVHTITDIDEDGGVELAVYSSSCASRWKALYVYTLKHQQWVEAGRATYVVGYDEPSIPERITKLSKGHFKIREIMPDTSAADAPRIDHELYFDMTNL